MSDSSLVYTYRAGRKVALEKEPDRFVVRALPGRLRELGLLDAEQVSSGSSRVTTSASELESAMSRSRELAPTHHAYRLAETGGEYLVTDRVLVTFREALGPEQVDAFAARYGLVRKASYGARDHLFQLTDHTGMNPVKLVVRLTEEEPLVEGAENDLNQRMKTYAVTVPTDPSYVAQWHLHTRRQHPQFDARSSSGCEAAWQRLDGFGSADVVVGVTDDGCKLDHPDFDSPGKFAGWGYFRGERLVVAGEVDAAPADMYQAGSNHGTSCAGVIGGEVDAVLTVGAAPGCRLLPIRWESSGPYLSISDSKLLTALGYVADKVDVLSNSWGGAPTSIWSSPVVRRITELARTGGRRGRGIVFLWAAGNENCPIDHRSAVAVPYTDGWEVRPDGSWVWVGVDTAREFRNNLVGVPGLMHVGALASHAVRSHYSNYGTGVRICAPTNNIHEYQRLSVPGLGITTATGAGSGLTDRFGGTSSATPLVAGIAALVVSANPDLTGLEVVSILARTASKDLEFQGYPKTPPASYDPTPTWDVSPVAPFDRGEFADIGDPDGTWSPWYGHGRVDASAAVLEAQRRRGGGAAAQVIRATSSPGLAIPDNDPAGVQDVLSFAEAAAVVSVTVQVALTHTYIGDLRLTLVSPGGVAVVLHDRNGGNAKDLRRAYDVATTPALAGLAGQPVTGAWTLRVQDLARVDVGRLDRWELEIRVGSESKVSLAESPGVAIPDNQPNGIERTLVTAAAGRVRSVEVGVDITHTYIGDLSVALVSPAGTRVTLHDRTGRDADNLIVTHTPATLPGLDRLRGEPIAGAWKLQVADREAVDLGKLNRWSLEITGES